MYEFNNIISDKIVMFPDIKHIVSK